jgi:hypothetical protein
MSVKRVIIFGLIGILVTPIATFLAIASAGGGHGHYVFAKVFFPYSLLLPHFFPDRMAEFPNSITLPWIILALIQFPLYGIAIGLATQKKLAGHLVCWLILLVHTIGVAMCFSGVIPNFS